jgi:hypothetical protein
MKKNLKSKISCQAPFNLAELLSIENVFFYDEETSYKLTYLKCVQLFQLFCAYSETGVILV